MRSLIALLIVVTACGTYIGPPAGPRLYCEHHTQPVLFGAHGSTSCTQTAADRCHPAHPMYARDVDSGFCKARDRDRQKHNARVTRRRQGGLIIASMVFAVAVVGVVAACSGSDQC